MVNLKKMTVALILATVAMAPHTASAGGCHKPKCSWKTVIRYRYESQPYYVYVTRYDHCGHAYKVRVKKWRTVKVAYQTRIKVCH